MIRTFGNVNLLKNPLFRPQGVINGTSKFFLIIIWWVLTESVILWWENINGYKAQPTRSKDHLVTIGVALWPNTNKIFFLPFFLSSFLMRLLSSFFINTSFKLLKTFVVVFRVLYREQFNIWKLHFSVLGFETHRDYQKSFFLSSSFLSFVLASCFSIVTPSHVQMFSLRGIFVVSEFCSTSSQHWKLHSVFGFRNSSRFLSFFVVVSQLFDAE